MNFSENNNSTTKKYGEWNEQAMAETLKFLVNQIESLDFRLMAAEKGLERIDKRRKYQREYMRKKRKK